MRHGKKFNHLGRKKGHRRALLSNLAAALIEHKRIQTTVAKAKALRLYLEPLVTKAKPSNLDTVAKNIHARRTVFRYLQNKHAVQELFDVIAPKVGDRPGGYLRIIKIGARFGDAAEMALIEFVDFNETYVVEKKAKSAGKKKRTRRGKKKSTETAPVEAKAEEAATEAAAPAPEAIADAGEATEAKVDNADENTEETA